MIRLSLLIAALLLPAATPALAVVADVDACAAKRDISAGKFLLCRLKADSRHAKKPDAEKLATSQLKCSAKIGADFAKWSDKYGAACVDIDEAAIEAYAAGASEALATVIAGGDWPGEAGGEPTPLDCTTNIDSDVPAFFKNYFQCVSISLSGGGTSVTITTDSLPHYESWYYAASDPLYIPFVSQGVGYFLNPNTIAAQSVSVTIDLTPTARGLTIDASLVDGVPMTNAAEHPMGAAGVSLNGIALFNPLAAPGADIADEIYSFDLYNAHPAMGGFYHYHLASPGPLEVLESAGLITQATPGSAEIEVYGIMGDGTVVLGCTELDGGTVSTGDFDAQNGHVHDLIDGDGTTHFASRYHTHMCAGALGGHPFTPEIQYYQ